MLIEVLDLSFVYMPGTPFEVKALRNVNMKIKSGQFVGIIGQTGSGKSTLIQHFNGLLQPSEGKVLVDGKEILRNSLALRYLRRRIVLLFQYPEHQLFEETVYEDIALGPKNLGLSGKEVDKRVWDAMRMVELDFSKYKDRPLFDLSGGEMRRVAIAGVLAMQPEVLILDEPAAGMDPEGRRAILGQIRRIHKEKGLTLILVSHNMDEVSRLADSLFVMYEGEIVLSGSPAVIFGGYSRLEQYGLTLPTMTELMHRLKERGCSVRTDVFTASEVRQELLALSRKGDCKSV
ncbi:MAG: energy-coupling factor transporter ATPase [Dehalococcoidia bacterium]|nr:Energy-coupling factor transporter ATP-binding protein EcfA2 [Chloroflexota bacterium]MBT9159464.1 Energy-coupling factor transporter ATP-binding protein EcfA2 [Chloroflexota bacterium]MBT9161713.1 Energy-coupling factor transporter ATP-binding protein EcfA2 [Chloroflexota bacterium]